MREIDQRTGLTVLEEHHEDGVLTRFTGPARTERRRGIGHVKAEEIQTWFMNGEVSTNAEGYSRAHFSDGVLTKQVKLDENLFPHTDDEEPSTVEYNEHGIAIRQAWEEHGHWRKGEAPVSITYGPRSAKSTDERYVLSKTYVSDDLKPRTDVFFPSGELVAA